MIHSRRLLRLARQITLSIGVSTTLILAWLTLGISIGVRSWLDVSGSPTRADAIVCLGGGTDLPNLPIDAGWRRIFTASQLFADDWAPLVVFSGRGSQAISEAEIYADAAGWLGVPQAAMVIDPWPTSTAEHAPSLLRLGDPRLTRTSRLLVVTSAMHARRALLTFRKYGFTNVVVVSDYRAQRRTRLTVQQPQRSAFKDFEPSTKSYSDLFGRLTMRLENVHVALREVAALGYYWWRGLI